MNFRRRGFLGSSFMMLGAYLLEALATPLWKWKSSLLLQQSPNPKSSQAPTKSVVKFIDVAREAGLTTPNVWGDPANKRYIIEAKGSGIAFFDYDNDGWLDIYLSNGSQLGREWPAAKAPTTHLYKNNRDGTFTDVTEKSGIGRTGWQTGVCVGDYNNDGWDDLFCTFWGHNILFRNNGDGTFTDVTIHSGLHNPNHRWGSGRTCNDSNRDSYLDLF